MQLSRLFGSGGTQLTFTIDRLQVSLGHARRAVVKANRALVAAERDARIRLRRVRSVKARAAHASLLSNQLDLERLAAQAGVALSRAQARVVRARAALEHAQADLASAQEQSTASSFAPAAGTMLGSPEYDGNYVFPVGGGPSVVVVSHFHHDYPAADIQAPMGEPVYALSDAIVERSWQYPDPRCGIGLTLTTSDGRSWTYCHLSVLDPRIVAGVSLTAGQQIGLVGMTGDATGPHLHLQLNPQSTYPQSLPWFRNFANVAFRWAEPAPPGYPEIPGPTTSGAGPVFAVVPQQKPASSGSMILFTR
jgi:murein DD-endopeptidase MepM/ murein hydrolase activator NlpD